MYENYPSKEVLDDLFDYSLITGDLIAKKPKQKRPIGMVIGGNTPRTVNGLETYKRVKYKCHTLQVHVVIWIMVTGKTPQELTIDHVDGDKHNNSWINLRLATKSEQKGHQRTHTNNTLPRGVRLEKDGRYSARIQHMGNREWLGMFKTIEEAQIAYLQREKEIRPGFQTIVQT